jgi:large subunit ribosomal protein L21
MFVIADVAGFQEKLEEGMKLFVPTLKAEEGKTVTFDTVYLVAKSDSDVKIGTPTVSGASVEAKVLSHGRGDKIRVFKMKRRKRYRRTYGHRQGYTEIEVLKIKVGSVAKAEPKKSEEEAKE